MRILRPSHFVKLGNLPNPRIKIERVNLIELKFDLTITLILISCERNLKSKYIASKDERISAIHIATTTIILTIVCSIEYCVIVVVLLLYLIKFTIKDLFILLYKMLRIIKLFFLI